MSLHNSHCVKSVHIRSFLWPAFPCIRTKYGEILLMRWMTYLRAQNGNVYMKPMAYDIE